VTKEQAAAITAALCDLIDRRIALNENPEEYSGSYMQEAALTAAFEALEQE
jgi:hypothetical protein